MNDPRSDTTPPTRETSWTDAAEALILRAREIASSDWRVPDVQKLINLDHLGKLRLEQQRYEEAEAERILSTEDGWG